jgi:3-methyl-2-oxobutanoate hydroxymethyltransferase
MPTVADLRSKGQQSDEPITMLTAYDAPTAELTEAAGIDVILVGDSMGNTVLGHDSTLPVTVEEVESRTAAVSRTVDEPLVVADMPFLSFGVSKADSIENAGRMIKQAGSDAVKLESGPHTVDLTERLVELGIPVMAHLGLTPQRVNQLGGYSRQGTTKADGQGILDLARAHEEAGAFSLVLEHIPANLATTVTEELDIPTIGIGAGPACDGQVLVITDVIGLGNWSPPFSKQFGDVRSEIGSAVGAYKKAVENGEFPAEEHSETVEEVEDVY